MTTKQSKETKEMNLEQINDQLKKFDIHFALRDKSHNVEVTCYDIKNYALWVKIAQLFTNYDN